jgi:peptidoglycan hydrolase-like protein with peptidoglycan-binding domain
MQRIAAGERCRCVARSIRSSLALKGALTVLVAAVAATGVGMWVGGTWAAQEAADDAGTITTTSSTSTTASTVPSTTTTVPTTTTAPTTTTTAPPPPAAADGKLEHGEEGDAIAALQARLGELGYWHGEPDGRYGQLTRQAVMAFQKAEGLGRDGTAGPETQARLATAVRPAPREPAGNHVEIDLARQILIVVEGGQTKWVLNTSTGNGEAYASPGGGTAVATTPPGRFTVVREIDGLRQAPLGTLYRPKYFHGGIAIHGAGEIPATPASHGCARVTNAAMDLLWASGVLAIGTPVLVY